MKLVALMIILPLVGLFILATLRPGKSPIPRPPAAGPNAPVNLPVESPPASPEEAALRTIKREDSSGRFPHLVSSLCRRFLEQYPESTHRAHVEIILKRNESAIVDAESADRSR